jgi:hypothetical protein
VVRVVVVVVAIRAVESESEGILGDLSLKS